VRRVLCASPAAVFAALVLAGCGLGAGPAPSAVHLTVTRDFGATVVGSFNAPKVHGQETVMSLLMRNATVTTRFGGGFVQSIDGLSGGRQAGAPVDWFYYVNGVEASQGAAATDVHPGDHIWWDRRDWSQNDNVPAVVGSFPEPFLNGLGGKRVPVRVECANVGAYACRTVGARLGAAGVPAATAASGGGDSPATLRVVVAPWAELRRATGLQAVEQGPRASGVYARFSSSGATLTLLDQEGRVTRTLGAGSGLIAALGQPEGMPVWVVSGTDVPGVSLAARNLDSAALENRFAVAISPTGSVLALPETAGSG
jgi:hypothetical protein